MALCFFFLLLLLHSEQNAIESAHNPYSEVAVIYLLVEASALHMFAIYVLKDGCVPFIGISKYSFS
jgi:hypothetical protein